MKRLLIVVSFFALLAPVTEAQLRIDRTGPLKAYAAKVLPQCPAGVLTLQPAAAGPAGLDAYVATIKSSDQYCGQQKYLLHSPRTNQVFVGMVVPLPADARPANVRIAEYVSKTLGQKMTAMVSPFPLGDGVKSVSILRITPFGQFNYAAFLDQSEKFLIIGFRGSLNVEPAKTIRDELAVSKQARRGNAVSKVEIVELSDFECPSCAAAHKKIEPLIRRNLGKINYIRIDLPLFENHPWAFQAAMAARAIQRVAPAKYWEFVDYVFMNQEEVGRQKIDDFVQEWAEDHDIDWAAMKKIYTSPAERQTLLDQVSRIFALGVASTPTFFVNGQMMGFGPEGQFTVNAIQTAMNQAAPAPAAKKPAK